MTRVDAVYKFEGHLFSDPRRLLPLFLWPDRGRELAACGTGPVKTVSSTAGGIWVRIEEDLAFVAKNEEMGVTR